MYTTRMVPYDIVREGYALGDLTVVLPPGRFVPHEPTLNGFNLHRVHPDALVYGDLFAENYFDTERGVMVDVADEWPIWIARRHIGWR